MVQAKPTSPIFNTADALFSNVICALPFEDGFGTTATDLSGNGLSGTLTAGATWFNDPTLGVVVQLDGTSGYVALSNLLNNAINSSPFVGGCTVSMWLRLRNDPPTVSTKTGLMDLGSLFLVGTASKWPAGGSFGGETNGNGYINVLRNSSRVSVGSLSGTVKTNWHNVVITNQAGGNWKLYINGALLNTTAADAFFSMTIPPILGRSTEPGGAGPFYLDGWLGDFRVYNRELILPEVQGLFNSPWNLYTVTVPLAQSRISAIMADVSWLQRREALRSFCTMIDYTPALVTASYNTTFQQAIPTSTSLAGGALPALLPELVLMADATPFKDPNTVNTPPNSPGPSPITGIASGFNPRLKPDNAQPPTLNADPVNSGTVFAMPFTEGVDSSPVSAPVAAASAGGAVTTGTHAWVYSYILASGEETSASPVSNTLNIAGGTQTVGLTGITVGPVGTTARKVYRTTSGSPGSAIYFLVTTISDNTTTTFSDTIADGSLGVFGPLSANDRSGNGNNGALQGGAAWDTSVSSTYYRNWTKAPAVSTPTGSGSYVRIPRAAVLEPSTAITLAAWVRPHAFPSGSISPIISKLANGSAVKSYMLGMNNSGQFFYIMTDTIDGQSTNLATGSNTFPNSQSTGPYFVVATYDGALTNLHVNGVLTNSVGNSGNIQYSPTPGDLYIGGDIANSNANADIDAVQIWNRALTLTEIKQLYATNYPGFTTTVPLQDPGSGVYGNYSNGALLDTTALIVDAAPQQRRESIRNVAVMFDCAPTIVTLMPNGINGFNTVGQSSGFVPVAGFGTVHSDVITGLSPIIRSSAIIIDATAAYENVALLGIGSIMPNTGSNQGGTAVTINGFNFLNVTAVFVGGVACTSVVVVNQTTITAVTGIHASGLVDVRVDSTTFGTTTAPNLYQYVGGLGSGSQALIRGKQLTTSLWHQDPPSSFYTGLVAPTGTNTTLSFTLTDKPTTPQAVEVYVRHTADTGYGRMRYLVDFDVDITNKHIIWLGNTAAFGLISSDEMIVCYLGQN